MGDLADPMPVREHRAGWAGAGSIWDQCLRQCRAVGEGPCSNNHGHAPVAGPVFPALGAGSGQFWASPCCRLGVQQERLIGVSRVWLGHLEYL